MFMKKNTIKEFGKLLYDFAKIGTALVIITPFIKGQDISIITILMIGGIIALGTYFINKGNDDG